MDEKNRLQESRKKAIPGLVEKYQKLVDDTFKAVTKELPVFQDRENKEGEVIATSEQQLFMFIDIRNKALDNANNMLLKINQLEIELYAPELFENDLKVKEAEENNTPAPVKKSWTKKKAEENK
ncbi:MAG: hypothetical protein H7Y10_03605 [Flavobacterium sp.]|nr:hypothetical protein [Flavobacterium sp.]